MLNFRAELPIMGIPTAFHATTPELLDAAVGPLECWRGGPREPGARTIEVRLSVDERVAASSAEARVEVVGPLLRLGGGGIRARADARRGIAECGVPSEMAANPGRLGVEVIDTLLLFLLTRAGRIPLHAAGIVMGGTAMVLTGPRGMGKSTLAVAALDARLPLLSDDAVYLQTEPAFKVWGYPRPVRVLPDAGRVGGRFATGRPSLRGGRWKIGVEVEDSAVSLGAERGVLCLLRRGARAALDPLDPAQAVELVMASLDPGFDHFREQLPAALQLLTRDGAWRLTLSPDPGEGLAALRGIAARR
jgi:hypothetical protein